ncbi:5-oxoprolinase subunit PxpB [Bergeriella denitrificans]|uniref:Putative allophanate hydrolase subunit 1 (AHS1) n=1 Tax=Bergeriella denitrificans TaxID=494 RepID=A0A378UG17_BERDE|nr:5-oxoprolinase subunit PxpB [Bergeriella denitrificans]STZ75372.1 putative allophanate hydrolase subunit 1 (AHS1) [Bergeriella denitrificans]
MKLEIHPISESALVCTLPAPADLSKQQTIWAFAADSESLSGVAEVVPGMNNLTVFAEPQTDLAALAGRLHDVWLRVGAAAYEGKTVEIPVVYGGAFGGDLAEVAAFHKITPEEVVKRHTAPTYTVFMMGFQPGFPYLGGLPEHLHTPRRAVPRTSVPAGSVGIGGGQTGVYPFASPGGWQIIGQTGLPLFRADLNPPTLLAAGDKVRFVAERIEK